MKKRVFLKIVLSLAVGLLLMDLSAQVPQGFNFQAVARSGNGAIMANAAISIRVGVIAATGTIKVWEETHSVTTSDIGLFKLIIGKGTRTAGTAAQFSDINWGIDKYSLKVELNAGTVYEDMGTSEIQSVPYAMVAGTLTTLPNITALSSLGIVEIDSHNTDSALFTVKNKDGNIVFAVYNEGVRINVADYPSVKGAKGGFAIGGFDQTKGATNEYMRVTPDSIRINLPDFPSVKGAKGGFAIGGFDQTKGTTNEYLRISPDSVRIYVDKTAAKGAKGGFAIGGFDQTKGSIEDFMHLTPDNYFIGHLAGSSITTGLYNSFFGYEAGLSNTTGDNNVFIGNETGNLNIDGNWNIFVGNTAGYSNTSGDGNIILGDGAGYSNTIGSWNVFMGDLAGSSNTDGESNVYIGADAGLSNTIGSYNVFLGSTSGYSNTEGTSNVFLGESSGFSNTLGNSNVFIGNESGHENLTGNYNVFMGEVAGWSNTIGEDNVFIGTSAGELNTNGSYNVFMGSSSGNSNTTGSYNVFLGELSGFSNNVGISNVFLGKEAGQANTSGSYNVFLGTLTGQENTIGQQNVFLGQEAGSLNTTGSYNVSIGTLSGSTNLTGSSNVFIGYQAGIDETGSNTLYIDNEGLAWDETLIYGEFDNNYLSFYANLDVAGDIYVTTVFQTSDKKYKTNIQNISGMLNNVMALRPVTFNWNTTEYPKGMFREGTQIGLIAQEVETLFPELVQTNKKGDKAVNYMNFSVILIQAVKEQQALINELKAENASQKESLQQLNSKVDALIQSLK